jgi:periplasmic protein TonB
MFDLITGQARHLPRRQTIPMLLSIGGEFAAVGLIAATSLMIATDHVPEIQTMMAFVAAPPPPAPPPPPPAPPAPRATPPAARPVPTTGAFAAPIETPARIEPEPGPDAGEEGVAGGVEGGVPGGVLDGVVGGLPEAPPPPMRTGPLRTGGEVKSPALLQRVEPVYPPMALAGNIEGVVILEAIVDENGVVQELKVLRAQPIFERAAIAAVRQWRYSPLLLNGKPERFILTVVLSFHLQK